MIDIEPKYSEDFLQIIEQFISSKVSETQSNGIVIAISGGLDSALVLKISSLIFPSSKITPVFLPESTTPPQDAKDARFIAKKCKVKLIEFPIDDILKSYLVINKLPKPGTLALGNLKARIRMNIIFLIANTLNRLVLGTSNKSELLLGYFTKFGDGASDVAPIGDLYKTQVYKMAEHLKLPKSLISKPPTAGLVINQTDEVDLGLDYLNIDKILMGLEHGMAVNTIAQILALPEEDVKKIKLRVEKNRHKRKFPKIPKIGIKTIGLDLYE